MKEAVSSFGGHTIEVIDRVGRKRVLIGLAVLAAAIGGTILVVRLVRGRADAATDAADDAVSGNAKQRRKARRAAEATGDAGVSAH